MAAHGKFAKTQSLQSSTARQRMAPGIPGVTADWSFEARLVAVAVASCFTVQAQANPTGAAVVSGSARIEQQGSVLSITNSPNAIINWQSFSIGVNELTRFIQPSAASAVLNRVVGQDPSAILGALQSNGRVFLINPNGILFGSSARIDVGGLVASTLDLANADFLAGRLKFNETPGAGSIVNDGAISTPTGGHVYLIAPDIENNGVITTPQGEIVLAAGRSVELVDAGSPDMRVQITAPDNQALNLGSMVASSGRIGIYAGLIWQKGTVSADTAVVGENGKIVLRATRDITLDQGSVTTASGTPGGVKDGGEVRIIADGTLAMRRGSEVHVDGGVDGGNGGFLELSGKQRMGLNGTYSARAQADGYVGGTLLLDPQNITITNAGTDIPGTSTSAESNFQISPANLDAGGVADVILEATNNISIQSFISDGDIQVGGSLTLNAGNNIVVDSVVGTSGQRFNHPLTMNAGNDIHVNGAIRMGAAALNITADATIPTLSVVSNGVGNVNITTQNFAALIDTLGPVNISGVDLTVTNRGLITTTGDVTANMSRNILVDGGEGINGNNVTLRGASLSVLGGSGFATESRIQASGDVILNISGAVNVTAGSGTDAFAEIVAGRDILSEDFGSSEPASIGTLTIQGGSNTSNSGDRYAKLDARRDVKLNISGGLSVLGGSASSFNAFGDRSASILAGNDIDIDATGNALVQGGSANLNSFYGGDVDVSATMRAQGNLTLHGNQIEILGGGAFSSADSNTVSANADATLAAVTGAMDLHAYVAGGGLRVRGGNAFAEASSGEGGGNATASANATVSAGGAMTILVDSGSFDVGGSGAQAVALASGNSAVATASANSTVTAGGGMTVTVTSGSMTVRGGGSGGGSGILCSDTGAVCAGAFFGGHAEAGAEAGVSSGGGTLSITALGLAVRGGDSRAQDLGSTSGFSSALALTAISRAGGSVSAQGLSLTLGTGGLRVGDAAQTAIAQAGSGATADADASASVTVTGAVTGSIGGTGLLLRAGDIAQATASSSNFNANVDFASANASASFIGGSITFTSIAGQVRIDGAPAQASAQTRNGSATAAADAFALLQATGGAVSVTSTGGVVVSGATGVSANGSGGSFSAQVQSTARGDGILSGAGGVTLNTPFVDVSGGQATAVDGFEGTSSVTALANGSILSGGGVNIVTGSVNISGGTTSAQANGGFGTLSARAEATGNIQGGAVVINTSANSLNIFGGNATAGASNFGAGTTTATALSNAGLIAGSFTYDGGEGFLDAGAATANGGIGAAEAASAQASAVILTSGLVSWTTTSTLAIRGGTATDDGLDAANGIAIADAIFDPAAITGNFSSGFLFIDGGTFTGNGRAEAWMQASGAIELNFLSFAEVFINGDLTASGGTGIIANPTSPVTISFLSPSGGSVFPTDNLSRGQAGIRTFPCLVGTCGGFPEEAVNNITGEINDSAKVGSTFEEIKEGEDDEEKEDTSCTI